MFAKRKKIVTVIPNQKKTLLPLAGFLYGGLVTSLTHVAGTSVRGKTFL